MHTHDTSAWKHAHHYASGNERDSERRTRYVVVLTLAMRAVEVAGGYLFNSMALLADGWHMFTHAGALAISPEVGNLERNFTDLRSILVMALDQEIQITENFNKITEHCQKARDYQTARFVQWYLDEQYEEERQARRCVEIFDQMNSKDAIFDIDREIHDLKKTN